MSETQNSNRVRMLCEGALCVAMAVVLSYLKVDLGAQGGSVNATMIPLILFAVRWGCGWGVGAGLVFGTLKYLVGADGAIDWISILFDYSVAYAFVGFAGVLKRRSGLTWLAALTGCAARFVVHYISGATVYARWMPESFMGMAMTSPLVYSALYNLAYMLPSSILAVAGCLLLSKVPAIARWLEGAKV